MSVFEMIKDIRMVVKRTGEVDKDWLIRNLDVLLDAEPKEEKKSEAAFLRVDGYRFLLFAGAVMAAYQVSEGNYGLATFFALFSLLGAIMEPI